MTGAELRAARETLGLTQEQLAVALRLPGKRAKQTISDWETGRQGAVPNATAALVVRAMLAFGLPDSWPT